MDAMATGKARGRAGSLHFVLSEAGHHSESMLRERSELSGYGTPFIIKTAGVQ